MIWTGLTRDHMIHMVPTSFHGDVIQRTVISQWLHTASHGLSGLGLVGEFVLEGDVGECIGANFKCILCSFPAVPLFCLLWLVAQWIRQESADICVFQAPNDFTSPLVIRTRIFIWA